MEYLAMPYSSGGATEEEMAYRADVSDFIFSELAKEGRVVYAPISSGHHVAVKYGLPRDWEFWKTMDEVFVGASERLLIVMLDGWETSTGLRAEMRIAEQNGIEIEYLDPKPYLKKMEAIKHGLYTSEDFSGPLEI